MKGRTFTVISLIVASALMRCLPHIPNMVPTVALALFGGCCLSNKRLAFGVVFASMLLSDAVLGFHTEMWATYLGLGLVVVLGSWMASRKTSLRLAGSTIAASAIFFVISNFGVWATSGTYAHSLEGLVACYTMAIPFFGNSLVGDMAFTLVLFGVFALIERANKRVAVEC